MPVAGPTQTMTRVFSQHTNEILKYIVLPSVFISPLVIYYYRHHVENLRDRNPNSATTQGTFKGRECRYRLDDSTSAIFVLPDGRKLGYAQYGATKGRPVIAFHGLPGSRLEATTWEDLCLKNDARIISVDRPGIGQSSPQPDRNILDFAKDIELLAEHLELSEFVIIGTSGGGPYALACAYALPTDKLKGVAVLCGLGPPDMSRRGMALQNWLGWTWGWRYTTSLVRWHFSRDITGRLDLDDEQRFDTLQKQFSLEKLHKRDAEWAKDEPYRHDLWRVLLRSTRESYAQGFDGFILDGHLLSKDWGFRLEDIRHDLPIQLWYGKYDELVPPGHGEMSLSRLGPKTSLRLLEETHSSLIINHKAKMLEDVLACL